MALDIRTKIKLQKEASQIKKDLAGTVDIRAKIKLQKRWSTIIKQLKGIVDDKGNSITEAANTAATGDNNTPEPTEKQKLAGNYKKGDITIAGIDIRIENPKGSTRSGKSKDGKEWSITMKHHYGDFKGSHGADGDPIDVFVGDSTEFDSVYIIDQVGKDGSFDEHKVMFGFDSLAEARKAYLSNYDAGWDGLGDITTMKLEPFKKWLKSTQTKPAGQLPQLANNFLDDYRSGRLFNLGPVPFSELILQAEQEGMDLDENKEIVTRYIQHHQQQAA
jgi:hypothetical protein